MTIRWVRCVSRSCRRVTWKLLAREAARKASVLQTQISAGRFFGWLLILAGLAGMGYFFFVFNVAVAGAEGAVVNLGLLNTRLVGAIISGFCFLARVLCVVRST